MKKRICVALVIAMLFCTLSVSADFSDTAGHWAEAAIAEWSERGIINGFEGKFRPNSPITRAEMAKIISSLLRLSDTAENTFSDVPADAWYCQDVLRCAAAGIITGYTDGTFRPTANITREEAMVMLGRALGIEPKAKADLKAFADAEKVSDWAAGYVGALVAKKIVSGVSKTELAPKADINRASVVTVLSNAIGCYAGAEGEYPASADKLTVVAARNVTLTGTAGDIIVTDAASNGSVTLNCTAKDVFLRSENTEIKLVRAYVSSIKAEKDAGCFYSTDGKSTLIKTSGVSKPGEEEKTVIPEGKGDIWSPIL